MFRITLMAVWPPDSRFHNTRAFPRNATQFVGLIACKLRCHTKVN
jgi:hypothetical protein